MNAVGIIAEYNPLHCGHVYHIKEAKRLAGSDAVVVAMSGDYVQRGEPAILDKWERTEMALNNGADAVVEIPTLFCLGNASQYGKAGVKILESFGSVKHIAFGSEIGNIDILSRLTRNLEDKNEEIKSIISELTKNGNSYPRARSIAYQELYPSDSMGTKALENSNDILAIEYLRAIRRVDPIVIKRIGANYSEAFNDSNRYQSASGIREAIFNGRSISGYVPKDVDVYLKKAAIEGTLSTTDRWLSTLKYAVMSMTADEIDSCPSGGEGLGNRIISNIDQAENWDNFVEIVKSKRYTHTRISRLFMQIILGINNNKQNIVVPHYIRILGFNDIGREIISQDNSGSTLPFITNINKQQTLLNSDAIHQLEMDIHAADIYNHMTGRSLTDKSDYRMRPIIL